MKLESLWKSAFCVLVTLGLGCALSNYELITDNDQTRNGRGSGIVDTNGKAHAFVFFQAAQIWPDGSDEIFSMVDQRSNGDRTLTSYNNFSTGDDPTLHDDLYCNPDWSGCAVFTAPDPEAGDVDPYDGRLNEQCSGARTLSLLGSTMRYYGECGRARMSLTDRLAILNMGAPARRYGMEGLLYDLDRSSLSIVVDDHLGTVASLPIAADSSLFLAPDRTPRVVLDVTNPLVAATARAYADFLRTHRPGHVTVNVTYNGISVPFEIGGALNTPERVLANANRRW